MDPMTLLGASQFAKPAGDLLGLPFQIYDNVENRKLQRRGLKETERNNKFRRLLELVNQSQGMQNNLAGADRLLALRNSGGTP